MVTIIVIGAVTALAMFAVLMKVFAGEPPDSENLQKGDIIKQLLALSELENPKSKTAPPHRLRAPSPGTTSQAPKASPSKQPKSSASNEPKPSPAKQPNSSQSNEPKSSPSKQEENASECVGL
jgi:hypothetical protein